MNLKLSLIIFVSFEFIARSSSWQSFCNDHSPIHGWNFINPIGGTLDYFIVSFYIKGTKVYRHNTTGDQMTEPIQFKTLFHLNQSDVLQDHIKSLNSLDAATFGQYVHGVQDSAQSRTHLIGFKGNKYYIFDLDRVDWEYRLLKPKVESVIKGVPFSLKIPSGNFNKAIWGIDQRNIINAVAWGFQVQLILLFSGQNVFIIKLGNAYDWLNVPKPTNRSIESMFGIQGPVDSAYFTLRNDQSRPLIIIKGNQFCSIQSINIIAFSKCNLEPINKLFKQCENPKPDVKLFSTPPTTTKEVVVTHQKITTKQVKTEETEETEQTEVQSETTKTTTKIIESLDENKKNKKISFLAKLFWALVLLIVVIAAGIFAFIFTLNRAVTRISMRESSKISNDQGSASELLKSIEFNTEKFDVNDDNFPKEQFHSNKSIWFENLVKGSFKYKYNLGKVPSDNSTFSVAFGQRQN